MHDHGSRDDLAPVRFDLADITLEVADPGPRDGPARGTAVDGDDIPILRTERVQEVGRQEPGAACDDPSGRGLHDAEGTVERRETQVIRLGRNG